MMTDSEGVTSTGGREQCDYCDGTDLVYEFHPGRGGTVHRCIECLAIEQGQQQLDMPFEVWINRDDIEPTDHPDDPIEDPFDPRKMGYETARAWFRVLARLKDDDPIIKRDPDAIGTVAENTREFLTNVMGEDAHKRPSEIRAESSPTEQEGVTRNTDSEQT